MAEVPKLKSQWKGRYVRLKREIERKDGVFFAKGEVMLVDHNYAGLHLWRIYACPRCGAKERQHISGIPEASVELLPLGYQPPPAVERPKIVVLCGSTRFWKTFQEVGLQLSEQRVIVLSLGAASGTDDDHYGHLSQAEHDAKIAVLNELHLRKIDLADEVMVLNVGGYVGVHTQAEIDHARAIRKPIVFLEPEGG